MGKLIVIDGLDGSGKGSITKMLKEYLEVRGKEVRSISFPTYGTKGAALVEMYLKGELGANPDDTNCYAASSFFAMDRYISYKTDWGEYLKKENAILIADRYTTANAVHQLTKLPEDEWDTFLTWLFDFEYTKLGLPEPDTTVYLEMPPSISRRLIAKRSDETGRTKDIHEKDSTHLEKAYKAALYASRKLGWSNVKNFQGDTTRPINDVLMEVVKVCGFDIQE